MDAGRIRFTIKGQIKVSGVPRHHKFWEFPPKVIKFYFSRDESDSARAIETIQKFPTSHQVSAAEETEILMARLHFATGCANAVVPTGWANRLQSVNAI